MVAKTGSATKSGSRFAAALAELRNEELSREGSEGRDANHNPTGLRLNQLPVDVLLAIFQFLPRWISCPGSS
jgi:hypothetical protein